MTRRWRILGILVILAMAAPASAQTTRDHRRRKPTPRVTARDFTPKSGDVGTQITVTGTGFTPDTKVLFGGYPVSVDKVTPTQLTFAVPPRYRDGSIVLRHPGVARDIVVGTFAVVAPPVITNFAPISGIAGTRVAIRGSGFRNGDQVTMGGVALPIHRLAPTRIIVTIPPGAPSAPIQVTRAGGAQSSSRRAFSVIQPAPTIVSVSPPGGAPGSVVRITGTNLTGAEKVRYAKVPMAIVERGPDYVDAMIPPRASRDQFVWLAGANGQARSPRPFRLEQPPTIKRIAPAKGTAGDRVDLIGANFRAGDRVTLNGRPLHIVQLRASQITATIPSGAQSGPLVVERAGQSYPSRQQFDVFYPPSITRFEPPGGEPGTVVTLHGTALSPDAKVSYGRRPLRVIRRGPDWLTVRIPKRHARDDRFTVHTKGGDAVSSQAFQIYTFATIDDVQPRNAFAGSRLVALGTNLSYADAVYLGRVPLSIVRHGGGDRQMGLEIPANATSGTLSFDSFGRRFPTKIAIEIQKRPILAAFSPKSGPPGCDISISGHNFTPRTQVFFGNTALTVVRQSPTELVARLPADASGVDHLWVEEIDARIRASQPFIVTTPPGVVGFSPATGKAGTQVTLTVRSVTPATEILLDNAPVAVVSRNGNQVVVQIPQGAGVGKLYFFARDKTGGSRSATPFTVLPSAVLRDFSPKRAVPGARITITGDHFDRTTRVFFGNRELAVVSVDRRGRKLLAALPRDLAPGSDYLLIDDQGAASGSRDKLQVVPPPRPHHRGKVRDHRKKSR